MKAKQWHQKFKTQHRKSMREKVYGAGAWQRYQDQLLEQNQRCAICSVHVNQLTHALSQDHNHETKELRGLLCSNCNQAIGKLKENPVTIAAALDYLLKWQAKTLEVTQCQQP